MDLLKAIEYAKDALEKSPDPDVVFFQAISGDWLVGSKEAVKPPSITCAEMAENPAYGVDINQRVCELAKACDNILKVVDAQSALAAIVLLAGKYVTIQRVGPKTLQKAISLSVMHYMLGPEDEDKA